MHTHIHKDAYITYKHTYMHTHTHTHTHRYIYTNTDTHAARLLNQQHRRAAINSSHSLTQSLTHVKHGHELLLGHQQALLVARVHHENHGVRVGVVAAPVGPDGGLAAQIPHLELNVLVLQHL